MSVQLTSIDAYNSIKAGLRGRRAAVLSVIESQPQGIALFEIRNILGWPINSVSGRVTELRKLGAIVDSGRRTTNPATDSQAIVWVVTQ